MASDILIYDADVVPVGADQKQHIELTRNIAECFNSRFGQTFKIPEGIFPKLGAKIRDLQDPSKKMSKSAENIKGTIFLKDSKEDIRKKISSATTDNLAYVKYDEENQPGISNLLSIYSCIKNISLENISKIV